MKFRDYYRILGVSPDASADDIKNAYRKLARKLHPDVNKEADAQQRFTELGEAYEALKDEQKRAAYDQLRAGGWREGQEIDAPPPVRRAQAGSAADFSEDDDRFSGFSDFFQSLFGGAAHGGFRRDAFRGRGEDLHHPIAVTLEESYHGGERHLQLQTPALDEHGRISASTRTITVKIPRGVIDGTRIRLRGQGQPGSTPEENGDLYLEVELAPHRFYRVDGHDILLEVPVAPWEAVLGARVPVPTLGGTVTATIPAGSRDGDKLRLKGRGLPGDQPGDQYLQLRIAVPAAASAKAEELYRELAKESSFNPRDKLGV